MSRQESPFGPELFRFLDELEANNRKEWFDAHKSVYEEHVRDAAFQFISELGALLRPTSSRFKTIPKISGGSLFRIYRDVRFAKDKRPYKDHVGIHFPHLDGAGVHAPGFYLHLKPGASFIGVGIHGPDSAAVRQIREHLVEHPGDWTAATGKDFQSRFRFDGQSLKRPPKGFAADHPLIDDLKRKDFIGIHDFSDEEIQSAGFVARYHGLCMAGMPLIRFLCRALDLAL